jgi:hypothetical protein
LYALYALSPVSLLFNLFIKKWCTFEESAADTVHVLASVAQMLLATRRHSENRIKEKKTFNETATTLISLLKV